MMIREIFINADKDAIFSETEPYEPFTNDTGKLFKSCQKEWGRCVSSVYVDTKDGRTKRVGWVFQKRDYYDRDDGSYIREVWVHLMDSYSKKTVIDVTDHEL